MNLQAKEVNMVLFLLMSLLVELAGLVNHPIKKKVPILKIGFVPGKYPIKGAPVWTV